VTFLPNASTKICPRCVSGVCDSGARSGLPCTVDDTITVGGVPAGADPVYPVSTDCLPSGAASGSVSFDLTVGTAMQSLANPCPGPTSPNNCGAGPCTAVCAAGANNGGIPQLCCSNNTSRPCFPNPIDRTGAEGAPSPLWPDVTYPKTGTATLVS